MLPHFPIRQPKPRQVPAAEPAPTAETPAATAKAEMTYAQMLQSLRDASPAKIVPATPRPPIDRITQIARDAADAYDKATGHDWTEYGLIDAVLAAVTPAIRAAR